MTTVKTQYLTLAPVTPKGKWVICSRKIGSKERFTVLAETRCESTADTIVDALNALQGAVDKIDAPSKARVKELADALSTERGRTQAARDDTRSKQIKLEELHKRVTQLEGDLYRCRLERDAAQTKAGEQA